LPVFLLSFFQLHNAVDLLAFHYYDYEIISSDGSQFPI